MTVDALVGPTEAEIEPASATDLSRCPLCGCANTECRGAANALQTVVIDRHHSPTLDHRWHELVNAWPQLRDEIQAAILRLAQISDE